MSHLPFYSNTDNCDYSQASLSLQSSLSDHPDVMKSGFCRSGHLPKILHHLWCMGVAFWRGGSSDCTSFIYSLLTGFPVSPGSPISPFCPGSPYKKQASKQIHAVWKLELKACHSHGFKTYYCITSLKHRTKIFQRVESATVTEVHKSQHFKQKKPT